MLGWSIIARAWRSASNRAITCFVSMPGLMIFRATLRRTGCDLLGHVDDAHAALADRLQQLVGADHCVRHEDRLDLHGGPLEEAAGPEVVRDEPLDAVPQPRIAGAGLLDEGLAFRGRGDRDRLLQNGLDTWRGGAHGRKAHTAMVSTSLCVIRRRDRSRW